MCTWTGCGVEMGSKVQSVFSDIPLGCFVRGSSEPSRPICSGGSEVGIELGRRDLRTAVCKAGRDQRDIGGLGGQPSAQDALPKVHGSGHRREASRDRQEQTGSDIPAEGGGRWFPGLLIPRGNLMPAHGRPSRNIRHGGAGREAARPQRTVSRDGRASPSRDSSCPQTRSPSAMARIREPWGLFSPIEGHGGALSSPGPGMDSWGAVMDSSHGVRMEGSIGTS